MFIRCCARILAAAAIWTITTLATAPFAAADGNDDYFLNELYKTHQKWYWPYGESYIIGVAHEVCDGWANATPYPEAVTALGIAKGWTPRNTRYFIALSTATYCPDQYAVRIPAEARLPDGH